MPRTRQYNDAEVRSGLITTFHEQGYSDTSLVDMEVGSGLNRRQLYNDYGDKKSIFLLVIKDFSSIAGQMFLKLLEQGSRGITDIKETLDHLIDMADTEKGRWGCLVCNSASESVAQDKDTNQLINQYFNRIQAAYHKALDRAALLGEIEKNIDTYSLSCAFLATHTSLCILCRAGQPIETLRTIGNEALKKLT